MPQDGSMIQRMDRTGVPLLLARVFLGAIFVWMGCHKIAHPVEFLKLIRLYHMLPEEPAIFLNSTAVVLPWLEVVCGAAVMLGVFLRGAGALMALMLAVFTPAIFLRAIHIVAEQGISFTDVQFDCGCGSGVVVIWQKLLKNTGLLAVALVPLFSRSRRFCLSKR